jgi:hypothetical protein
MSEAPDTIGPDAVWARPAEPDNASVRTANAAARATKQQLMRTWCRCGTVNLNQRAGAPGFRRRENGQREALAQGETPPHARLREKPTAFGRYTP